MTVREFPRTFCRISLNRSSPRRALVKEQDWAWIQCSASLRSTTATSTWIPSPGGPCFRFCCLWRTRNKKACIFRRPFVQVHLGTRLPKRRECTLIANGVGEAVRRRATKIRQGKCGHSVAAVLRAQQLKQNEVIRYGE